MSKGYLYIMAGTKEFKEKLEESDINTGINDLLIIEKDSSEDLSIKDNLKEILNYRINKTTENSTWVWVIKNALLLI